jgi:hypothetical protein
MIGLGLFLVCVSISVELFPSFSVLSIEVSFGILGGVAASFDQGNETTDSGVVVPA